MPVRILALIWLLQSCGGRTVEAAQEPKPWEPNPDAKTADGGAGDAAAEDSAATADSHSTADATGDFPADVRSGPPDWDAGPQSCNDVGKFPGLSACCEAQYCAGSCLVPKTGSCVCETTIGGCIWPAICCNGLCVGPTLCK